MGDLISRLSEIRSQYNCFNESEEPYYRALSEVIKMLSEQADGDTISRQAAIDALLCKGQSSRRYKLGETRELNLDEITEAIGSVPTVQTKQEESKYEYHYDHTDCIWYRPEARNRCPSTCAQYRDGWNDAMNYIFRDGKGYRPYRRGERYE